MKVIVLNLMFLQNLHARLSAVDQALPHIFPIFVFEIIFKWRVAKIVAVCGNSSSEDLSDQVDESNTV